MHLPFRSNAGINTQVPKQEVQKNWLIENSLMYKSKKGQDGSIAGAMVRDAKRMYECVGSDVW